ncbi:hypothetical protein LCGC14_2388740, partial [marine sediment metagenome]
FELQARIDGLTGYHFTEKSTEGVMVAAARRKDYFPVYFVEPLKGNEAAVGFDLASDPTRLEALNRARDTGQVQATARITLVQETAKQYGILVFQPIYQNGTSPETVTERRLQLLGFALGVLRLGDIIGVEAKEHNDTPMEIFIFDETAPLGQQLLFPAQSKVQNYDELNPELCLSIPLQVGGRVWKTAQCLPEYHASYFAHHATSSLALFTGLLITSLLVLYQLTQAKQQLTTQAILSRLASSKEHLRQIMDNVEDAIITSDEAGIIQSVNRAACKIFGYSLTQLVGQPIKILMPASSHKAHDKGFNHFIKTRQATFLGKFRVEAIARRKDGSEFPVDISVTHNEQTFIAVITDISLRKEIELEKETVQQRMREFFNVTLEGLFFHKEGIIIDANESGARLLGTSPAEIIGHSLFDYISPEYHAHANECMQSGCIEPWEAELIHKDGSSTPVEIQNQEAVYREESMRVVAVRNICERRLAEQSARSMAIELAQLIDTANAPIFGIDSNGLLNEWNKNAELITGYGKDEVVGRNLVNDFI